MSDDPRYWVLDADWDNRQDLAASELYCVVDENEGGIIAYTTSDWAAARIIAAFEASDV